MLLQCPLDGEKIQGLLREKHPDCSMFGYIACPVCHSHLQGHGWRRRYLQDGADTCRTIWIHRKRCPVCGRTYTLLPGIIHVLKLYTLETIVKVLSHRLEKGHFTRRIPVPVRLQSIWFGQFMRRSRSGTNFPDLGMILSSGDQSLASPVSLRKLDNPVNPACALTRQVKPHHPLVLLLRSHVT